MCFDLDSHPPIPPLAGAAIDGRKIDLHASDGKRFAAFAADATSPTGAAMIIYPDVRGLHPFFEELALRFAEGGVDAVAIDYFGRTAPDDNRGEGFEYMPHVEQMRYETIMLDTRAAREHLASRRGAHAVFSMGFCIGGRLAFLSATRPELAMSGVIGFYGWPIGQGRGATPAPADVASDMHCPVLGLFGGNDHGIPPEAVEEFEAVLTEAGIDHELVTYPGAPHSFFDRKATEFADASTDSWERVVEFVQRHTPARV